LTVLIFPLWEQLVYSLCLSLANCPLGIIRPVINHKIIAYFNEQVEAGDLQAGR